MKLMTLAIAAILWAGGAGWAEDRRSQVAGIVTSAQTGEPLNGSSVSLSPLGPDPKPDSKPQPRPMAVSDFPEFLPANFS